MKKGNKCPLYIIILIKMISLLKLCKIINCDNLALLDLPKHYRFLCN